MDRVQTELPDQKNVVGGSGWLASRLVFCFHLF